MNGDQLLKSFTGSTTGVLGYLQKQLAGFGLWINPPGTLVKVSTSSSGYIWGYTRAGTIYSCREPCTDGGWKTVLDTAPATMLDIVTDSTEVYILYTSSGNTYLSRAPVDGTGEWSMTEVPFAATSLAVTNGYLWASGDSKTAFCGKPCTTGNWKVQDPDTHMLVSGGASSVYATTPGELGIVRTDETAQSGWTPVHSLDGLAIDSLAAEADNTVVYGADSSKLYRCDQTSCSTIDSQGYVPLPTKGSISVNPSTKNVWMATASSGTNGNLFSRLDAPDSSTILNTVTEFDTQRDNDFNSLGNALQVQTAQVASHMAKEEAYSAVKNALGAMGDTSSSNQEIELLKRKIGYAQRVDSAYASRLIPLTILLVALCSVVLIYLVAGWLLPTWATMGSAFVILAAGFGLAIYFSRTT